MSEYVLEVLDGESAGQVISLDKERLSLGRRPGNDVVLKDEKASGNHAEVVREGDAWVLRDLGSRNGTRMDGRDVKEVGLSPGDVFQVGLTRIGFRRAEDPSLRVPAAEGEGAEGFAMHRVDQARLQRVKGGRGMLPMVAALLVVAGAGVWVWLRYGGDREPGAPRRQREVVSVPGNLLANDVAAVDRADAFDLGGGGADFVIGSPAHSGANALTVERGEGAPFAVARLREPLRVIADDTLEVSAHVSCSGGAQVALRVLFTSSREEEQLALLAGSPFGGSEDWQPLRATFVVPSGLDRARLEVVALLPDAESAASVDDLAVVRGSGKGSALTAKNGVRLVTSGASAALVFAQEILFHALRPVPAPGTPLAALDAAARLTLAEVGGSIEASVADDTFSLAVRGVDAYALDFDGGGLLARGSADQPFTSRSAEFEDRITEVLVGSGRTRLLLALPEPAAVQGRNVGGGYRLTFTGAPELRLVVGFEEERREARERVREARAAAQAERFGQALPLLQEVADRFPHDDAVLGEALQLRAEILEGMRARLDGLARDLDTARFFAARSGLVRVLADLDALVAAYGEANLGGDGLVERLRSEASGLLADLDAQSFAERRPGLEKLAEGLRAGGNAELAQVIEDYLRNHGRKQ